MTQVDTGRVTRTPTTTLTAAGPLRLTWHEPIGTPVGVAVVAPGVAVPARVMAPLADALAVAGWRALRLEWHGTGESPIPPRSVAGAMAEWGSRDLDAVLRLGAEAARGVGPLVLVGHSAGAWLLSLTPMAAEVDGVLAIASMSGWWRDLKRSAWPQLVPAFHVGIPLLTRVTGILPGWAGLREDSPGRALRQWASWCRHPGFLFDDPSLDTHLDQLTAPVQVLLPTDDAWATEAACRGVWDHAERASVRYTTVDPADHDGQPIGHMGLLRDRFAATVWQDAITWLGSTSGVDR